MSKEEAYYNAHSKSRRVGLILAALFGPLGLLYSNWIAAIILTSVVIGTSSTVIIPIVIWVVSMALSVMFVDKFNDKVIATAKLFSSDN
jgi:hypothetical protein